MRPAEVAVVGVATVAHQALGLVASVVLLAQGGGKHRARAVRVRAVKLSLAVLLVAGLAQFRSVVFVVAPGARQRVSVLVVQPVVRHATDKQAPIYIVRKPKYI